MVSAGIRQMIHCVWSNGEFIDCCLYIPFEETDTMKYNGIGFAEG